MFALRCLLIGLLGLSLGVDMLNGYLTTVSGGIPVPLSASFKLLLLSLSALIALSTRTLNTILLLFALLLSSFGIVSGAYDNTAGGSILNAAQSLLRGWVYAFVFFALAMSPRRVTPRYFRIVRFGLALAVFIFLLNSTLAMAGYGYYMYGSGGQEIGAKGFFYAGNEISAVFVTLFGHVVFHFRHKTYHRWLSYSIASLLALALATKVAILGAVVVIVAAEAYFAGQKKHFVSFRVLVIGVLTLVLILFQWEWILESAGLKARWDWAVSQGGIQRAIFSGRIAEIGRELESIASASPSVWLFGRGAYGVPENNYTESDAVDLFLWSGVVGLLSYLVVYWNVLRVAISPLRRNERRYARLQGLLWLLIAVVAGHVFTSGMLGPIMGLVLISYYLRGVLGDEENEDRGSKLKIPIG